MACVKGAIFAVMVSASALVGAPAAQATMFCDQNGCISMAAPSQAPAGQMVAAPATRAIKHRAVAAYAPQQQAGGVVIVSRPSFATYGGRATISSTARWRPTR